MADIIRVWGWAWVMLQRGLGIIKISFQKASQPMKHCFLEGVGGVKARLIFAHFGAKRCRACRRHWALALQNAINTAKNCCAERWGGRSVRFAFAVAGSRAAQSLRWFFGPSGARACARPQPQNTAIYGVVLHLRFRPGLRAALFGLLFLGPLARARDPMSAFWVGARLGPRSWHPRHHLRLGWATCIIKASQLTDPHCWG